MLYILQCSQMGKGGGCPTPKSILPFSIDDLQTCPEESFKAIDGYLEQRSYLYGYEPSSIDKDALKCLKNRKTPANWSNYGNLERWFLHISSFSDAEQNKFLVLLLSLFY